MCERVGGGGERDRCSLDGLTNNRNSEREREKRRRRETEREREEEKEEKRRNVRCCLMWI